MDIRIDFDKAQLFAVKARLAAIKASVPKVLAAAVNDTAKQQKTKISTRIRERVNIKKKDIDPHINFRRATPSNPECVLRLSKTSRIGLKYFGAKQTKQGVTYSIAKGGGRKLAKGVFGPKIPRLGGQVYKRVGKKRLPIRKLRGVSPWGVFVKAGMENVTLYSAKVDLQNNLERRVRLELLRKAGKVK